MWLIFQGLIIFGIVTSNAYLHWTPNGYLASLIGVGAAWLATYVILKGQELRHRLVRERSGDQRSLRR